MQAVHQQHGGAMCEMEEDERRQQHRRATTGVCERGEALCEDAEQQVRTMILVVRESMRRRYISQRYCRSRQRYRLGNSRRRRIIFPHFPNRYRNPQ